MPAAICLNHPRREAAARCTSCGGNFCRECITEFEGRRVCGPCYREKVRVKDKPRRDWGLLTATLQLGVGVGLVWLGAWVLGRILVSLPSEFHEGTTWERFKF